ncbi:WD40 repeat domain-containing protein [Phanerochaete sordida]|uniref:WD40 repeat domain-containing protein n=1 Tax=Phanerochaete sordida TaxID=48140 RepID=A0A9P3GJ86_9APHY|nr:WD40 repeat domain-containing protein [Phanerochaete sordida]
MSFKKADLFPCNPATTRGESTRISSSKDKIAYTNGRTVIIRDLKAPSAVVSYAGHVQNATVAKISPTGYYCASGDASGTVKIWDLVGEDQTLKGEYKVVAGRIKDLDWDGESKRIIAVGEGRDKFGHAFMFDTGSSTGSIIGHSKTVNAVSIRHQRPYRAVTAGDDCTIVFHQGAPYKYEKTIKTHSKFIQDVRYAPSGDHFASVGMDMKIFLYDGKEGETVAEITDSPHTGSIMALSWSPDSTAFVTSSADRTVKLWDVETRKAVTTWNLGKAVEQQQVGNAWTEGGDIVSLSLSGDLNVFDKRAGDKPSRVLYGPSKAVTALTPTSSSGTFIAGLADGRVLSFDTDYKYAEGAGHKNLVSGATTLPDGKVATIGYDDLVREIDGVSFTQASCPTTSQPKSIAAAADSTLFVVEIGVVEAIRSNQKVHELKPKYTPSVVAAHGTTVAIGSDEQKVYLYEWDGKSLTETAVLEGNRGALSALAFSPDGSQLAAGDSSGKIALFDAKAKKFITSRWSFHSGRILSLAWTPDGKHCASGSLDTHVYVYSVAKPGNAIAIKNAHAGSVSSVFWVNDGKLASVGADGCFRTWEITFFA